MLITFSVQNLFAASKTITKFRIPHYIFNETTWPMLITEKSVIYMHMHILYMQLLYVIVVVVVVAIDNIFYNFETFSNEHPNSGSGSGSECL